MQVFQKLMFPMNPFSGKFQSNYSFVFLGVADFERLHRKASKDQKEILVCALQYSCSKLGKAQGERLLRSPVLESLPCNFIKTGLHRWHFPRNVPTFLDQAISQNTFKILIGKGVHLFSESHHYCFERVQGNCRSVIGEVLYLLSEYW